MKKQKKINCTFTGEQNRNANCSLILKNILKKNIWLPDISLAQPIKMPLFRTREKKKQWNYSFRKTRHVPNFRNGRKQLVDGNVFFSSPPLSSLSPPRVYGFQFAKIKPKSWPKLFRVCTSQDVSPKKSSPRLFQSSTLFQNMLRLKGGRHE